MSPRSTLFVPSHGAPKTSLRVPGAFDIHLCPLGCTRRTSLRAERNGSAPHEAYLSLSEADLATGAYEEELIEAVGDVLALVSPTPPALFVHVNCVDDFLGTDDAALLERLRGAYPSVRFGLIRMNPIAEERGLAPGERIHEQLYRLIDEGQPRDGGINLVGGFAPVGRDSEIHDVAAALGVPAVRALFACETFADYQALGRSALNIAVSPLGRYAARVMERRLGIPWVYAPVSYEVSVVDGAYEAMEEVASLGDEAQRAQAAQVRARARQDALDVLAAAQQALDGRALVVDSSASMTPAALAAALVRQGFNVAAVMLLHEKKSDEPDIAWLERHAPQVRVLRIVTADRLAAASLEDAVCIGFDSAYLLRAPHWVDLRKDEGLFGYQAAARLGRDLVGAVSHVHEWEGERP